jgi:hypothetical protein
MSFSIRFAEPRDQETCLKWAVSNPNIPKEDLLETGQHPTATAIVIEQDGVPVLFFPLWAIVRVGFLGFNPETNSDDRKQALNVGLQALKAFAQNFGISEAQFTSSAADEYPMLRWGRTKGLTKLDKSVFKMKVGK